MTKDLDELSNSSLLHSRPLRPGDSVFLVDASSFIFRAYYQSLRQDSKYNYRSDRLPTGAVRLFCTKLLQFIREGAAGRHPTHLAIIFDKSEKSFRKELYPAYKANRRELPEDLIPQFSLIRQAVQAFGLIPVEKDSFEADDLIATYAKYAQKQGAEVLIISADKDLMQIVDEKISLYDPASGEAGKAGARAERRIGLQEVVDYFGVPPALVVDVQALAGDSTDNIPGAPGIGIKTAAQLIQTYGSLESLLQSAAQIKQEKRRAVLMDEEIIKKIHLSRILVTLRQDVETEIPLEDMVLGDIEPTRLISFLKALEFSMLVKRIAQIYDVDASLIESDPALVGAKAWGNKSAEKSTQEMDSDLSVNIEKEKEGQEGEIRNASDPLSQTRQRFLQNKKIDYQTYETILSIESLERWIREGYEEGVIAVDTETTGLDPLQADLVGISLSTRVGSAAYIPLGHREMSQNKDLFEEQPRLKEQLSYDEVLSRLKPLLEDPSILKIGHNIKYDILILNRYGIKLTCFDDTMLLSYVLDAGRHGHGMDELSEIHLHHKTISFKEVAGSGKTFIGFACVSLEQATSYAAEDAEVTLRLWKLLKPRLIEEKKTFVYERLERPLIDVLVHMEQSGISIDQKILAKLSNEFSQGMMTLQAKIYDHVGESFNLASPKQLGDILFGKMGFPGGKKTATGIWSTAAGVLEDLAEQGYELAELMVEWRQLAKLKSTYTDSLPHYIHPQTHRVHTSYSLASTSTGRLSSSEPNLQNIPIKNEQGRKIRAAFIACPGFQILSADYSQIELRLLAHIAHIQQLQQAFSENIDIHAMTASEIFNIPLKNMTSEIRRRAKAINFGIIYGISAFGLARQLGISREESASYIKSYFERFPGIRDYMEETKKKCRELGYVVTLFGRRIFYPQIQSSKAAERGFNERAAINAPIQGSAADIIRRAMIHMEKALEEKRLRAKMLLQVHDELVFEVPEDEIEKTVPVVRHIMREAAYPVITLSVPLEVEVHTAHNWDQAH